jgi:hypothetical protein
MLHLKTKVITASINKIYTENRNILGAELEKPSLYRTYIRKNL